MITKLTPNIVLHQNTVNYYCNVHARAICAILKHYQGQKVLKADGSMVKALKAAIDTYIAGYASKTGNTRIWVEESRYNFCLHMDFFLARENGEGGGDYLKAYIFLGDIHNGFLSAVNDIDATGRALKEDYNYQEIASAKAQIRSLQNQIDSLQYVTQHFEGSFRIE